jgi:SAM-dependent methyltransferase
MANSPNSTNGASLSANTDRGVRVSEPLRFPDKRSREEARAYFQPFLKYFRGRHAVVDVACGQGHFLELLKEAGVEGVGVEVDAELCAVCREKGLPVIHDDLFVHLRSVAPGTYDAAHVSHIIEHLPPPQVAELFRLLHRILPPGAPMVVLTPNIANLHQVAGYFWHEPTHVRPYPIAAISKLLQATGWEVIESGEHQRRSPSLLQRIKYRIRNVLIGRYWCGDSVYVIARRAEDLPPHLRR